MRKEGWKDSFYRGKESFQLESTWTKVRILTAAWKKCMLFVLEKG